MSTWAVIAAKHHRDEHQGQDDHIKGLDVVEPAGELRAGLISASRARR
jgi:hypothetical protein